jgi:hypothetical protein
MKNVRLILGCFLVISLLLTGCHPVSSEISGEGTPTTITTSQKIHKYPSFPKLNHNSLNEFKETLLSFKSESDLFPTFKAKNPHNWEVLWSISPNNFPMVLQEKAFLVPVLPDGWELRSAILYYNGACEFIVRDSNENRITFEYRLTKQDKPSARLAIREEFWKQNDSFTNQDGCTIYAYQLDTEEESHSFPERFKWQQQDCYLYARCESSTYSICKTFLQNLSFEKVTIPS